MAVRFRCYALPLISGIILLWVPLLEAANIRSPYCPSPPKVDNTIALTVQTVPVGGYVNYTCKDNFYAFGITTAMCIIKNHQRTRWIGPDMICEKMCGKPPDSPRAYPVNSTKDRYPPYMVIEYRCKYGRLTLGSATTVCRNGKWKAASFFCMKQCGRPRSVPNTKLITSYPDQKQFREKTTVSYKCNEGYHQTGINLAWCFRGKWRGPYINCTVSREKLNELCGVPPEIENGEARIRDEPVRHVIYSCADGMKLTGSATLNCQARGVWDNEPPKCLLKESFCGKPPSILEARHNASLVRPAFPHGSALLYSCIPGYFHVGNTIARCDGTTASWKDLTMKCEPMHCSPPGEISGGRIEGSKYTYMSKIFFHCDIGHKLIGQKFRVCQEDGNWDGPMSTCQREVCPILEKPENGGKFGSNRYNDVTKYVCYTGFKLVGDVERRCTENLTWTGSQPKCVPFQCRTLKPPINGHVAAEYSVNSLANYSCHIGFELQGPVSRRCREDETWTGTEPQCIETGCKAPEPLWLGTISGSSYKSGSIIFFSCNYDTTFEGKTASSVCVNSQWSTETPKCYAKCTVPDVRGLNIFQQDFLNLIRLKPYDTIKHKATVNYHCVPGYRPSVPKLLSCYNGTWTKDIKCTEDNSSLCEEPLTPVNGLMTLETTPDDPNRIEPGTHAIYSCKPGYSLHGKKRIICGDNGRWEGDTPRCMFFYPDAKKCTDPGTPENGHREISDSSFGLNTVVTFYCNPGYTLYGREKITCSSNFMWLYPKPKCIRFAMG
ncbi:sushi, von Willebrand factor type A, EGF and pentraxin domain-containing protein 1 [Octopus bimaculoides]|uniref:sushi, von Willebrand factor type A, EGF and pentraxin domain-containing protein 1 n=1 Tax=Octopus bimaculoides TaxID=37653 RepID=UPI00071C9607|nr:sushi, von Willebrand factor type A, EGF and pentraxin domain-containing protein 1 [Octopus bimaculoides]|eukprot:XP_014767624.1 PREDICTED: sushi, von Willebrand factor type A, EGF and pentraxin domain-containing protein 1-like [Octopus bimaculoides]